ncbi:MAG: hydantoinase B/oxoprolinase family protein, partial [Chloroflexi bacterium]|nr:hydantoinase B/oxoprolinase family protein [Chloroflexota bacterium]
PYLGGTHLPDISIVSGVYADAGTLLGYVTNRAHHADVGGMSPGSMPVATELHQEGFIIPPLLIREAGRLNEGAHALILRNSRTPEERRGDLAAQQAAQEVGAQRLRELAARYGVDGLRAAMTALMDYAEAMTRAALRAIPDGVYTFEDALDDAGPGLEPAPIRVAVTIAGDQFTADFTGSAPEQPGSINAVPAVTRSATYYVVRCLLDEETPANDGCFRPVTVIAPEGTVVNPRPQRAVSAGNVETSQRITDVLLGALAQALPGRIPAASQGSMNNVTIGGYDPERGRPFAYYETIAGGAGAGPNGDGLSAVHTHMTNTLNTPAEALEFAYPFGVGAYSARDGSGGAGLHRGGDGIRRVYTFSTPAQVTIISERRRIAPYGLAGGSPGALGRNVLHRADGAAEELPSKISLAVQPGDQVEILTPGGGGWGAPSGEA